MPPSREGPRANEFITKPQVRLIDETGENRGVVDTEEAIGMAANVGLDLEKLRVDMRDPGVLRYLEEIRLLAESLDVTGTPVFIIGDAIRRGGTTAEELKAELRRQRARREIATK